MMREIEKLTRVMAQVGEKYGIGVAQTATNGVGGFKGNHPNYRGYKAAVF